MIISIIVAMDNRRGIGLNGHLPWHLSSDLRRFKAITMGHHVVMGRKTYESIGKPLPGRTMILISRTQTYRAEECLVVHSLDEALEIARSAGEGEIFIIGGGNIFRQALPLADRIYLTIVPAAVEADTYFPKIQMDDWSEIESSFIPAGADDDYDHTYKLLVRADKHHQP